jgi:hypothetical protein
MLSTKRQPRVGRWGLVGISAAALVLVAAVSEPDASWERLRALSPNGRSHLLENLRRFDLELTPEQRDAVREIDHRLADLQPDERARYESVLHRYHAWLASLPENRQAELAAKPAAERMALVRKLAAEHPVPSADTQPVLKVVEAGAWSPFELASAYKIWQVLDPTRRARIERLNELARHEALLNFGPRLNPAIPREIVPEDFDEARWTAAVQDYLRGNRPGLLIDDAERKRLEETARKKAESLDEPARKKFEDVVKRKDSVRRRILRHQAINLYLVRAEVRSVDSQRLTRFFTALPAWIQTSMDALPPDEARKRLTLAYRLDFPYPQEIDSVRKAADKTTRARPAPGKKPAGAQAPRPKAAPSGDGAAPF